MEKRLEGQTQNLQEQKKAVTETVEFIKQELKTFVDQITVLENNKQKLQFYKEVLGMQLQAAELKLQQIDKELGN